MEGTKINFKILTIIFTVLISLRLFQPLNLNIQKIPLKQKTLIPITASQRQRISTHILILPSSITESHTKLKKKKTPERY